MEKKRLISLPEKLDNLVVEKSKELGATVTGTIKQLLWGCFEEHEKPRAESAK